jgi:hypothetical protein
MFYAWLGVLWYLSFPANYFAINLFVNSATLRSLLLLASVTSFGFLTLRPARSWRKFLLLIFIWYFGILIAIKMTSAEKMIVPVFIIFLLLRHQFIYAALGAKRCWVVFLVSTLLVMAVVPQRYFGISARFLSSSQLLDDQNSASKGFGSKKKEQLVRQYHFQNVYHKLVHESGKDCPLMTVFRKEPPTNLTEHLGFFSGWLFWIFLIGAFFWRRRIVDNAHSESERFQVEHLSHFYLLFFLWLLVMSLGMGGKFAAVNLRYLNYILLPAVPLFFIVTAIYERLMFQRSYLKSR